MRVSVSGHACVGWGQTLTTLTLALTLTLTLTQTLTQTLTLTLTWGL